MEGHNTLGSATPEMVVLDTISKQAEQAKKQHPSVASATLPAFQFLP